MWYNEGMSKFTDYTPYRALVIISERIHMCLKTLAQTHEVNIMRMSVEDDKVRYTFTVDDAMYLIVGYYRDANVNEEWKVYCPKAWDNGYEPVTPSDLATGAFIKEGDL